MKNDKLITVEYLTSVESLGYIKTEKQRNECCTHSTLGNS